MVFKINKVAKNLFSVGVSSLLSQLFTFFMIAYYARILSIEGFGRISLAQSIMIYFTMITLFGFQTLGTREVAKDKNNYGELVGNIISLRLFTASICFLIVMIIAYASGKGIEFRTILIIYGLTLFPLAFNIDWLYSGIEQMQHNAVYNIIKNIVPFLLLFSFFKREEDIYFIPIFTLCGLIFSALYHMLTYRKEINLRFGLKISRKQALKYIRLSTPFLISGLLSMINCNVDSVIIGFMRSEYELGIYSSAYKVVFFLTNLIAVIFTPFFPLLISYYHEKDEKGLNRIIKSLCKIVVLIGFPMSIGGVILSKEIIILLFGEKYIEAYVPFIVLMVYILVLFMRETYGYSLNAWNMEDKYLKSVIISAVMNLALNLIFIPKYGIIAAAFTTLISEIINFIIMRRYSIKVVRTDYFMNFIKLLLPLGIMCFCILILKHLQVHVLVNILLAIIIYFIAIVFFKYITLNELKSFMKK